MGVACIGSTISGNLDITEAVAQGEIWKQLGDSRAKWGRNPQTWKNLVKGAKGPDAS